MNEVSGKDACPKDHKKSMPTLLKFDRTCVCDIMTFVRNRRVARWNNHSRVLKIKIFTTKVCSESVIMKVGTIGRQDESQATVAEGGHKK